MATKTTGETPATTNSSMSGLKKIHVGYCLSNILTANVAYLAFGVLHELSHFVSGCAIGISKWSDLESSATWYDFILRRYNPLHEYTDGQASFSCWKFYFVQHFGWMATVLLTLLYRKVSASSTTSRAITSSGNNDANRWILLAAYVTVIDALSSDLFLMHPFRSLPSDGRKIFFCGNFGIITLNAAWYLDKGEKVLDILEKMVQVTMMRGAQTGGVVTFSEEKNNSNLKGPASMKGHRARCVKTKRGDLSVQIRNSVKPMLSSAIAMAEKSKDEGRFFGGHTRFATSSIADLAGCHPHQWSKPYQHSVYDFSGAGSLRPKPQKRRVENFISHNGDFEYFKLNGQSFHGDTVIDWLEFALGSNKPCTVDSIGIAGLIDILRCCGCFALSIRYVICLGLPSSNITTDPNVTNFYPSMKDYEALGNVFEEALHHFHSQHGVNLEQIRSDPRTRQNFIDSVVIFLSSRKSCMDAFLLYVDNDGLGESIPTVPHFVEKVCNAFFDNDLMQAVKLFMSMAKGSFGLCAMSSIDAKNQICLASRGQTISIAFYPQTGLVCYGSEQAAVKAGVGVNLPMKQGESYSDEVADRLDLNDLAGEICLLDWNPDKSVQAVSPPNRGIKPYYRFGERMRVYLFCESRGFKAVESLHKRLTPLTNNEFITPLPPDSSDLIRQDLKDIPMICKQIQDNWNYVQDTFTLNRLTAWNLGSSIKRRLDELVEGKTKFTNKRVDILVTGCEVSLWLGEQFATDLQKSFPGLNIISMSANKLLGLFGQETISVPTIGFDTSVKTLDLHNAITIIVSHSGGTFSPLACSSLFQSMTRNIFVVTSEWDTQIGKQLRAVNANNDNGIAGFIDSRIFTTGVGLRPAEPCSVSVAATHQLLTNIFKHISVLILSDHRYRDVTRSVISENDLRILARCNERNIDALADIVGVELDDSLSYDRATVDGDHWSDHSLNESSREYKEHELREAGDIWSDHILEIPKAYIMSILYILGTVISGYPLASGIAFAAGLNSSSKILYLIRAIDALIYIWLPQINVLILRVLQGRPLRHRITGRTVVIGDIPWVAQAGEAFLSKIFACSYSIAGLNVHSGNPSDHLVHRHTHRVVRGSLIVAGRPDGRLSALSAMENAVSLSISQASSIQSIGGRCESVTIGHNPFKLPLTERAIFLDRHRPLFMCEHIEENSWDHSNFDDIMFSTDVKLDSLMARILQRTDLNEKNLQQPISDNYDSSRSLTDTSDSQKNQMRNHSSRAATRKSSVNLSGSKSSSALNLMKKYSRRSLMRKSSVNLSESKSSSALLGIYKDFYNVNLKKINLHSVLADILADLKWSCDIRRLFDALDTKKDGRLYPEEWLHGMKARSDKTEEELMAIFHILDNDDSGYLTFDEFTEIMEMNEIEIFLATKVIHRDERGLIQVLPSCEEYFGKSQVTEVGKTANARKNAEIETARNQTFVQELYESRIASLQRFVAMTVMFHQMGWRVERFFSKNSFGLLGYRMDRTHSIMRIATTASPVSGADIWSCAQTLYYKNKIYSSVALTARCIRDFLRRKQVA